MKAIRPLEAEGTSCAFQTRMTPTYSGKKSKLGMLLVVKRRVPDWAFKATPTNKL